MTNCELGKDIRNESEIRIYGIENELDSNKE